jgi:phosphopantothenoylcysteine decarboxylase/phosphopantothenate--cysteine ligase
MRKIVLGVTGSIAAYKAAELARLFVKNGDEVRVMMTKAACEFVAPLTFKTLARSSVSIDTFESPGKWEIGHISLAEWADLVVIAPATANTLAKMRCGIADNLLTSVVLAAKCPVAVAPAMNCGMWSNAATKDNVAVLKSRGVKVLGPASGFLACGAEGEGRMLEPSEIFASL